jgi:RNA recognition motif-containing protein
MNQKLYVGNLTDATTEGDLRELFTEAGTVTACELIKDRASGQSMGFAFVTMGSPVEAAEATRMFHAYALENQSLTVNAARPREARRPYSDRPMARGSGRRE